MDSRPASGAPSPPPPHHPAPADTAAPPAPHAAAPPLAHAPSGPHAAQPEPHPQSFPFPRQLLVHAQSDAHQRAASFPEPAFQSPHPQQPAAHHHPPVNIPPRHAPSVADTPPAAQMAKQKSKEAMRKRPLENADKPPAKKPKDVSTAKQKDPPAAKPGAPAAKQKEAPVAKPAKRRLTWFDSIRDAWQILQSQNPGKHHFRMREIIKVVDAAWSTLRPEEKKLKGWKNQLSKAIRRDAMLMRAPGEGHSDLYAMKDPDFQPPVKKASSPEADATPEEPVYRATIPTEWTAEAFKPVRLSTFDKSAALQFVNAHPNTIKGHKGYRMARATSGVLEGDWYFEATVVQLRDPGDTDNGAVRLGWSQRRSDVETPVGFDAYGFGIRDRTGEFVHAARLKPYGESFGVGDVIGCRISLPQLTEEQKASVEEADRKWLEYRFIHFLQGQQPSDSGVDIIASATVQFYKNGTALGVPTFFTDAKSAAAAAAEVDTVGSDKQKDSRQQRKAKADGRHKDAGKSFSPKSATAPKREMKAGMYYPSVALYGNAIVTASFGPDFRYAVPEGARAMCEAAREAPPPEPVVIDPAEPSERAAEAPADSSPSDAANATPGSSNPSLPGTSPQIPADAGQGSLNPASAEGTTNLSDHVPVASTEGAAPEDTTEKDGQGAEPAAAEAEDVTSKATEQPHLEPRAVKV